jgi:Flp pilus assembly pilin Flp
MTPLRSWLKDLMASERRGAKRKSFGSLVAFYPDGSTPLAHSVQNASTAGFYLVTDQRWYLGTILTMTLQKKNVPEGEKGRSIEVLARVIRSDDNGVAFAFVLPQGPAHHESIPLSRLADKKCLGRFLRRLKEDETSVSVEFAPLAALVSLLIASVFQFKLENWSAIWSVAAFATAIASWHTSSARACQRTDWRRKSVYYVGESLGPRINSAQMGYSPSESWQKSAVVPSVLAQPCSGRT